MNAILYWLTQNSIDVPEDENWLSAGERTILHRLRFPKRRKDWLLGRWTAKRAICAYQSRRDSALSSLEIRAASDGAPEAFWDGAPGTVALSISHSNERSFCLVGPSGFLIGCDLERIETRENRFLEDYFTAEEIGSCRSAPVEHDLAVNLIWSAKESALKALRQGLRRDTRSILVHPDFRESEGPWSPWKARCLESSRAFYGWWRSSNGYIYTLASDHLTSPPEPVCL